jgi:hypothetical protein
LVKDKSAPSIVASVAASSPNNRNSPTQAGAPSSGRYGQPRVPGGLGGQRDIRGRVGIQRDVARRGHWLPPVEPRR